MKFQKQTTARRICAGLFGLYVLVMLDLLFFQRQGLFSPYAATLEFVIQWTMKVVWVGTKVLPCTSFVRNQVPAQPLRSLDPATGGAPLRALRDDFNFDCTIIQRRRGDPCGRPQCAPSGDRKGRPYE